MVGREIWREPLKNRQKETQIVDLEYSEKQ
jgi:hypothetical protein